MSFPPLSRVPSSQTICPLHAVCSFSTSMETPSVFDALLGFSVPATTPCAFAVPGVSSRRPSSMSEIGFSDIAPNNSASASSSDFLGQVLVVEISISPDLEVSSTSIFFNEVSSCSRSSLSLPISVASDVGIGES